MTMMKQAMMIAALGAMVACSPEASDEPAKPQVADPVTDSAPQLPAVAGPAATPGYVGVWGATPEQCGNPQEVEDAPMIFTADGYDQYEAHCDYDVVEQTGESTWTLSGSCSVQGDVQKDTMVIRIEGDQMMFLDETGAAFARNVRCDSPL